MMNETNEGNVRAVVFTWILFLLLLLFAFLAWTNKMPLVQYNFSIVGSGRLNEGIIIE